MVVHVLMIDVVCGLTFKNTVQCDFSKNKNEALALQPLTAAIWPGALGVNLIAMMW